MRTRATNDAADQVASHSSILSAECAWQGLRACRWDEMELTSPEQSCQSLPPLASVS